MRTYNTSSLYGNYRTRTFAEIYSVDGNITASTFDEDWKASPFYMDMTSGIDANLVFYLLYARYGNSHIAASDENRFRYQLYSIMFQYGPTWNKQLEIQKEIQELDINAFREGSRTITNLAENPSVQPSTQDTEELEYVNSQSVNKTTRSYADAVALLNALLKTDVTEEFLDRFKKLFLTIVEPELPLWYETYPEEDA